MDIFELHEKYPTNFENALKTVNWVHFLKLWEQGRTDLASGNVVAALLRKCDELDKSIKICADTWSR